jgi:hypothetical protein
LDFPDFVVKTGGLLGTSRHGYEVRQVDTDNLQSLGSIKNAILRGYLEVKGGKLSSFTLVLALPQRAVEKLTADIYAQVNDIAAKAPITAITLGVVQGSQFYPLHTAEGKILRNE